MAIERNSFVEDKAMRFTRAYYALRSGLEEQGLADIPAIGALLEGIRKEASLLLKGDPQADLPQAAQEKMKGPQFVEQFGTLEGLVERYDAFQGGGGKDQARSRQMEQQIGELLQALEQQDAGIAKKVVTAMYKGVGGQEFPRVYNDLFLQLNNLRQYSSEFRRLYEAQMAQYEQRVSPARTQRSTSRIVEEPKRREAANFPGGAVNKSPRQRGIALQGIDAVKTAIQTFYSGRVQGSDAKQASLMQDGGLAGAFASVPLEQVHAGQKESWMDKRLEEMEQSLARRGFYRRHFDDDGVGPFLKTTVDVRPIPGEEQMYMLELNAAYAGDRVEKNLAAMLEIERGMASISVGKDMPVVADKCHIDFDKLLRRVQGVLDVNDVSGEQVVAKILAHKPNDTPNGIVLGKCAANKNLTIALSMECIGWRLDHPSFDVDLWSGEGSKLIVPVREEWEDRTKVLQPRVDFVISVAEPKKDVVGSSLPTFDAAIKREMGELAKELEQALTE